MGSHRQGICILGGLRDFQRLFSPHCINHLSPPQHRPVGSGCGTGRGVEHMNARGALEECWMVGTRRGCGVLNRRRWHYLYCAGAPASISTAQIRHGETLLPPWIRTDAPAQSVGGCPGDVEMGTMATKSIDAGSSRNPAFPI